MLGQKMTVKPHKSSDLVWVAKDPKGKSWFEATIETMDFTALKTTNEEISDQLAKLLKCAVRLNSEFLDKWNGYKVTTELQFDRSWGLGSSSTLTYMVAEWADVHPLMLHFKYSQGSGYDVAVAMAESPIVYFTNDDETSYTPIDFSPSFRNHLFFVHLGKKASTQDAIQGYLKSGKKRKTLAAQLSDITDNIVGCKDVLQFGQHLEQHNAYVGEALGVKVTDLYPFSDFNGVIKPLGAWGGDFCMAVSSDPDDQVSSYFNNRGLKTVIKYDDMILPT